MRRTLVLGSAVAVTLAGAAVALAGGGDDDYGYGSGSTTTVDSTATATVESTATKSGKSTAAKTKTYSYRATLTPNSEVPAPKAPAKAAGVFTATVKDNGRSATVRWTLTFARLSGKAIAAHIHLGKAGVAGPVVLPLCGPCKTGANGRGTLTHDQAEMLEEGRGYANVHTAKNQAGEIRGQLKLVGHA